MEDGAAKEQAEGHGLQNQLKSKELQLESQKRELTQLRSQMGEVERRMVEAEKSRASLLRELDAMRDGKSSMVKDLIQARDESAEEAAVLSRKIQALNQRLVATQQDLEEAQVRTVIID